MHKTDHYTSIYGIKAQGLIDPSGLSNMVIPKTHPIFDQKIINLFVECNGNLEKKWLDIDARSIKHKIDDNLVKANNLTKQHLKDHYFAQLKILVKDLRINNDWQTIYEVLENATYIYQQAILKTYNSSLTQELQIVFESIVKACQYLQIIIDNAKLQQENKDEYFNQKIYAVNILENVIFEKDNSKFNGTYSLEQIVTAIDLQEKHLYLLQANSSMDPEIKELLLLALKVTNLCVSADFKQQLLHYLQILAANHRQAFMQLGIMIKRYQQDGLLETAINMLPSLKDVEKSPVHAIEIFKAQWLHYNSIYSSELINNLNYTKQLNAAWQDKIELWAMPEAFEQLKKQFQPFVENFENQVIALNKYEDLFVKQLLINYIKESLDIYNSILKELNSSPQYASKENQAKNFSLLLESYYKISCYFVKKSSLVYKNKILRVEEKINNIYDSARNYGFRHYLEPTVNFNVANAVFTNEANPYNVLNNFKTFADIFTLAHQNLLSALNLHQSHCVNFERLPQYVQDFLKKCIESLDVWQDQSSNCILINWSFIYPQAILTYNYSLREHSVQLKISYDTSAKQNIVKLHINILTNNENNRLVRTRKHAALFGIKANNAAVKFWGYSPILDINEVTANAFEWEINMNSISSNEIVNFKEHLEALMKITIGMTDREESFSKDKCHYPGMFKNSFVGVDEVLQNMSSVHNLEQLFTVIEEILESMIEKMHLDMDVELEILSKSEWLNMALKLLLYANAPDIRARTLRLLTNIITEPVNLPVLLDGCLINKFNKNRFYFINQLHDKVIIKEQLKPKREGIFLQNALARLKNR